MKTFRTIFAALFATVLLSGCGGSDGVFASKRAPDEFAVPSRAPLALPPDFSIRPPTPGAKRPQGIDPRKEAEKTLRSSGRASRRDKVEGAASPGLNALLKETGGLDADPSIRDTLRRETSDLTRGDATFTNRLLGWAGKKPVKKTGVVIDPNSESRRIKASQAEGAPVSTGSAIGSATGSATGGPAPSISRDEAPKKKGFWSSIF